MVGYLAVTTDSFSVCLYKCIKEQLAKDFCVDK